jgi:hypothetical protein
VNYLCVNYLWAYYFGRGIVDPPNTFDPARLAPDDPPLSPWTLHPSNAKLLNALAQHCVDRQLQREVDHAGDRQQRHVSAIEPL